MAIKVMSQHTMHWESSTHALYVNRRPLIRRAVLKSGADVIGFQEVKPH